MSHKKNHFKLTAGAISAILAVSTFSSPACAVGTISEPQINSSVVYGVAEIGDANFDSEVSLADSIMIMQSIANPSKYGSEGSNPNHITGDGIKRADVYGLFDGLTNSDALAIQKYMLGIIDTVNPWEMED